MTQGNRSTTKVKPRMNKRAWGHSILNMEEQFQLKRQVVLDTASRIFSKRGYESTTLADLAKELNIAKPTLYYYFKSKDEILYEIHRSAIASIIDIEPGAIDNHKDQEASPPERLERFLRRYATMITSEAGNCLSTAPFQLLKPETQSRLAAASRKVDQSLRDILSAGIENGTFRQCDVKLTAGLIFGSLNWIPHWYHQPDGPSVQQISANLNEFVLESLKQRDTPPC